MTASKRVTHWASETVYECCEIAGYPQYVYLIFLLFHITSLNLTKSIKMQLFEVNLTIYARYSLRQWTMALTLIRPGEVKVDLADFDLKLRENLFINLIFKKRPIPAKTSSESFWTSHMTSKNDVLTVILTIFHQKSDRGTILPTPPSVSQHSKFQSVSSRGPRRVRGMAGSQSGLFSRSF